MPVSAWAADRFGASVAFRAAIVVFTAASILCGISETLWELTLARMLQGVGGSMIIYLAGLQGIPTDLYDAAHVDGANR